MSAPPPPPPPPPAQGVSVKNLRPITPPPCSNAPAPPPPPKPGTSKRSTNDRNQTREKFKFERVALENLTFDCWNTAYDIQRSSSGSAGVFFVATQKGTAVLKGCSDEAPFFRCQNILTCSLNKWLLLW